MLYFSDVAINWIRQKQKMDSLKGSPDSDHSALQTRCEANGLSTGALADGPSIDVLTAQGFVLGDR
jgi:hypothetical protein